MEGRRLIKPQTISDAALLPKSDVTLETAVIGCILNDPANAYNRLASVSVEDFTDENNTKVYNAILKSWSEKGTVDFVTVGSFLRGDPGAIQRFASCRNAVGIGTEFDKSLQRLKEITSERKAHEYTINFLKDMHEGRCNISDFISKLQLAQSRSISFEAYRCDSFFAEKMEEVSPLLLCQGKGIVYPGDVTTVQGQAKTRKTTIITAISATLTSGETCLHFSTTKPMKTLIIDTEQSAFNLNKQGQRARELGADFSKIEAFALRSVPDNQRRLEYTLQAAYKFRPDVIIIDNVKDLVRDFNDLAESTSVVNQLLKLAEDLSCGIIAIIHENIDSEKARGHIGSTLKEKASTVIRTSVAPEAPEITKVSFPTTRNAPVEDFSFRLDEDVLPELIDYTPPGNSDELKSIFTKVFETVQAGSLNKDVVNAVMQVTNKGKSTAKTLIRQATQLQIIYVSQKKYYLSTKGQV